MRVRVVVRPYDAGEHATTRLCLGWLRTNGVEGQYVMDFGTGSGVLAIGALLMGADKAVGVDNDPLSVGSVAPVSCYFTRTRSFAVAVEYTRRRLHGASITHVVKMSVIFVFILPFARGVRETTGIKKKKKKKKAKKKAKAVRKK